MISSFLTHLGLTPDQAETYEFLLSSGSLTPSQLMTLSGESRTNAYMSLAKLEELGLATRDESAAKLTYNPVSPSKLEEMLDKKQQEIDRNKQRLAEELPELLSTYYKSTKKPGIRFYEGKEGLKQVYQDHLDTNQDVYFVRTPADEAFFGKELYDYMDRRAEQGITAYGIGPATKGRLEYAAENNERLNRKMFWCRPSQYRSPVEISIYGTKVAFISFGDEAVSTIIDSQQIAGAMRELFMMAKSDLKSDNEFRPGGIGK